MASEDTKRALAAAKVLLDGRDSRADTGGVMVTLETLVSMILLLVMDNDHRKAVGMLHEGLLPGVEERIALGASRRKQEG